MWRSFILLLISATTGWANEAVDLSLAEKAVKLLQIENVQRLKKSLHQTETLLKEKDQELEALKVESDQVVKTLQVELENTKSSHATQMADLQSKHATQVAAMKASHATEVANMKSNHSAQVADMISSHAEKLEEQRKSLQEEIDKSWTLVDFMMEVVKKSKEAAKTREELVNSQATMLVQLKEEVAECKENIEDSLKMARDSQEVIQAQQGTIEDLKSALVMESSLNATFHEIKEANLLKSNCDTPAYINVITKALSTQQGEIELLKKSVSDESNVADVLKTINKDASRAAEVVGAQCGNWTLLEQCQDVLEKQSSSLDLLRTLASERVTRDNSLRFKQDPEGHIIAADFCQCIPDPSEHYSPVSLSLALVNNSWSPMWTSWEYNNCERKTLSNGDVVDIGNGSKTRRRLKALDAESWDEDVEEIPCAPAQCHKYNELNSSTRKLTSSTTSSYCDKSSHSRDWKGTGWYRVTGGAGTQLADTQVASRHCGTQATGYLTGGHPSVEEGEVTRTVNFNWDGKPASWTKTVRVTNCGSYYVYHLVDVGGVCDLGYCTM